MSRSCDTNKETYDRLTLAAILTTRREGSVDSAQCGFDRKLMFAEPEDGCCAVVWRYYEAQDYAVLVCVILIPAGLDCSLDLASARLISTAGGLEPRS
ncbi:unnamed protein product [Protopolystoma xenopodis]|uniref:Uncharacterized protein n=1 Tax=Protopolystoma xenopodis TaxID=117903 RepID=A0A448WW33_9PLAT|nr:unnamed protein product [Protopolystoma xenopodis]